MRSVTAAAPAASGSTACLSASYFPDTGLKGFPLFSQQVRLEEPTVPQASMIPAGPTEVSGSKNGMA